MGGLFPKQDGQLSYQPRYPLLLAGETSSYFSYFHGSLNSLASAKTIGWLQYVGMFGLLHRANKNL